jgi:hypothetical protein
MTQSQNSSCFAKKASKARGEARQLKTGQHAESHIPNQVPFTEFHFDFRIDDFEHVWECCV